MAARKPDPILEYLKTLFQNGLQSHKTRVLKKKYSHLPHFVSRAKSAEFLYRHKKTILKLLDEIEKPPSTKGKKKAPKKH